MAEAQVMTAAILHSLLSKKLDYIAIFEEKLCNAGVVTVCGVSGVLDELR